MRYTLWSRGRLLGYTELDLPHVQEHIRMGFIEPTAEGLRVLPDATGVPAAAHALAKAAKRAVNRRETGLTEFADFLSACDRREALGLELRDEADVVLGCEWIQINDLGDPLLSDDEFDDFDELYDDEPLDPELQASIDHDAELFEEFCREHDYDRAWEPPDERWEMPGYHMMVYLGREKESGADLR